MNSLGVFRRTITIVSVDHSPGTWLVIDMITTCTGGAFHAGGSNEGDFT